MKRFLALINLFSYQLDAVQTANVKTPKFVQTGSAWMLAWQTIHVQATPSATPPTTKPPADAHLAWKETHTLSAGGLSAESTRTALRTLPVSLPDVSTPVSTKILAHNTPPALFKTISPNASAHLGGLETLWSLALQRQSQLEHHLSPSATWMATAPTTRLA